MNQPTSRLQIFDPEAEPEQQPEQQTEPVNHTDDLTIRADALVEIHQRSVEAIVDLADKMSWQLVQCSRTN